MGGGGDDDDDDDVGVRRRTRGQVQQVSREFKQLPGSCSRPFSPPGREESLTQRGIAVKQFLKNTFAVY